MGCGAQAYYRRGDAQVQSVLAGCATQNSRNREGSEEGTLPAEARLRGPQLKRGRSDDLPRSAVEEECDADAGVRRS
jgi:hypothetical protein